MSKKISYVKLSGLFLAMCLTSSLVQAHDDDDDRHERHEQHRHTQTERDRHAMKLNDAKLRDECGSCHVVYPPKMLGAESWREIMQHLNHHFGSDASVNDASQRELSEMLQANAGEQEYASGKPVLRLSESSWFEDEHAEISPRTWRNPKVKSASNCGACHTKADQGRFGEHEVRVPR